MPRAILNGSHMVDGQAEGLGSVETEWRQKGGLDSGEGGGTESKVARADRAAGGAKDALGVCLQST